MRLENDLQESAVFATAEVAGVAGVEFDRAHRVGYEIRLSAGDAAAVHRHLISYRLLVPGLFGVSSGVGVGCIGTDRFDFNAERNCGFSVAGGIEVPLNRVLLLMVPMSIDTALGTSASATSIGLNLGLTNP
jgi:hypothetical protein